MHPVTSPTTAEITKIYLAKEHRGKGLGKFLLDHLIARATDLKYERLFLTTRKEFQVATHIYQKAGFKQIVNEKYPGHANSTAWELKM